MTNYRSLWYEGKVLMINTRNKDGGIRTINEMVEVHRNFVRFRTLSAPLHDWVTKYGDFNCLKCGAWGPGYRTPPARGCNKSTELVASLRD